MNLTGIVSTTFGVIIAIILLFIPSNDSKSKTIILVIVSVLLIIGGILEYLNQAKIDKENSNNQKDLLTAIKGLTGTDPVNIFGNQMIDGKLYSLAESPGINHSLLKEGNIIYLKTIYPDFASGSAIFKLINKNLVPIDINLPYPIIEYQLIIDPKIISMRNATNIDKMKVLNEVYFDKNRKVTFITKNGKLISIPERHGDDINITFKNIERKITISL